MRPLERILEGSLATRGYRGPNTRGEYSLCCPFCHRISGSPDDKFKLQYNPTKNVYHCYKCSTSGRAVLPSLSNGNALEPLEKPVYDLGPPKGFYTFAEAGKAVSAKPFIKYMEDRGYPLGLLGRVDAGFCVSGRYAGRVVIPLKSMEFSAWRGFSARAVYPSIHPKYLYPAGMDRKNELWGLDFARPLDVVYLVEGVLDALALYPHGLAAFGKAVTNEQIEHIKLRQQLGRGCKQVIVCLDGDAWEDCLVLAVRMVFAGVTDVSWCKLPPKTDPGILKWDVEKYIQEP
jgi:DNA primase